METSILKFKIVKDIEEAKFWWNFFSPKDTIYDEWEFRFCFYKYFNHELFFYVGYLDNQPIGLLPLQYNSEKKFLEFFGDYEAWMDQNKIFISKEHEQYVRHFYEKINVSAKVNSLVGTDPFTVSLPIEINSYGYFLPLTGMHSCLDYFNKYLQSKKRTNFKALIHKAEEAQCKVVKGEIKDLENLFDLNIKNFGKESSFLFPFRKEIFRDIAQLKIGTPNILVFYINSKVEGVTFGFLYNKIYTALNAGVNKDLPFSLNSFATFKKIDVAIEKGATLYDARGGNYGWKEEWHFEKFPQYKFEKII